jgi:hypothetical protein
VTERRETELEMAQRHVREDDQRLARQIDIVAQLERRKFHEAAALAKRVLKNMHVTLDMARRHLEAIEKRSKR